MAFTFDEIKNIVALPQYEGKNFTDIEDEIAVKHNEKKTPEEYLYEVKDQQNKEIGSKISDMISGNPVREMIFAPISGLDQFSSGLSGLNSQNKRAPSPGQYASEEIKSNINWGPEFLGSNLGQTLYNVGQSIGNMAPSIAFGAMTGGSGALLTGLSAGGNAQDEALREGYSKAEALTYGAVNGALEGGLQYALGGIGSLGKGGASKLIAKIPALQSLGSITQSVIKNKTVQAALNTAGKYIAQMGDEAFEEYLQAVLDPVVRNIVLKEDNDVNLLSQEAMYSALVGALTAGIMNIPSAMSGSRSQINEPNTPINENQNPGDSNLSNNENTEILSDSVGNNENRTYDNGKIRIPSQGEEIVSLLTPVDNSTVQISEKPETYTLSTPDLSEQAKKNRGAFARETGASVDIDPDVVEIAARIAEQTGRNIQFVKTLGNGIEGKYDAATGTLTIAADSPSPLKAILKHELTHSLEGTRAYTELSDFVMAEFVQKDAEANGMSVDEFIQAKMTQYAESGETLTREGAVKELVADYCAAKLFADEKAIRQLSAEKPSVARRIWAWLRSVKTKLLGTKQEKLIAKAEALYRDALMGPMKKGNGTMYSIETVPDGRQYVKADREVIHGENPKEWRKQVQNYINDSIRNGKDVVVYGADGDALTITKDTAGKARFRNSIALPDGSHRQMTDSEFATKLRAETHIDELAQASTRGKYDVPDSKNHPFAKDGFNYRTAYFLDNDGSYYRITLSVGKNGEVNTVYNVGKIKEAKFPFVAQRPPIKNNGKGGLASNTTVPQSTDSVNTSIPIGGENSTQSAIGFLGEDTAAAMKRLVEQYGAIKPGEAPSRDVQIPQQTNDSSRTRRFVRTALESAQVPDGFVNGITQDVMNDVYSYVPSSNESAMRQAVSIVEEQGLEQAVKQWEASVNGKHGPDKNDIALGEYLLTLAGKNNDPALASKLIIDLATAGTNAGQVVQAMSMLKRMTPEGRLLSLQRVAEKINRERPDSHVKVPEAIIEKIQRINPQDTEAIDNVVQEGLVALAEQVPAKWLDKWNAWRYLAMLGNPRTHVRNVVGNAMFTPVVYTKNILAGLIEGAVDSASKAAGKEGITRTKTALSALPFAKRQEYLDFARSDFKKIESELSGGGNRNPADVIRDNQTVFKSKLMKPVEVARKANSRAMEAEDMAFKRLHYQRALMQYLAANKIDVSHIDETTLKRGRNYAIREAQKATFADVSALANALNRFSRSNKAAQFAVEGLLPFKKTPVNLLKRGVEYSPAGLLDTVTRKSRQLAKGDITVAEYIDSLSAGLTGTGVVMLGMWLKSIGVLVGGLGDDKEDQFDELQGEQEYAIRIGDSSYTIDWAAPVILPLLVGAEIEGMRQSSKDGEIPFDKMLESLANLSEPVVNMSMLQGINDSIENVKFSDNPLTDLVLNAGASYLSQGVPTLFGQIARTSDDTRRRNYVEQGSAFSSLQYAAQRAKSKIPGALQTQQPYVDAWGREEPTGSLLERAVNNFLSPGYTSKIQTSDMEEELKRLYKETGEASVFPSSASKSVTYKGEKYALSAEEYTDYQHTAGKTAYSTLERLTRTGAYKSLSDEQKVEAVSIVYEYAKDLAKGEFLETKGIEYSPGSKREDIDTAEKNGVPLSTYLLYTLRTKELKADKDENGDTIAGSLKEKKEAELSKMDVTDRQKEVLLAMDGYGSKEERERILSGRSRSKESEIDKLLKGAIS